MKPAPFAYFRPDTVQEAVACLSAQPGDACVLAGGQSLLPRMHQRSARPAVLVDLGGIPDLWHISIDTGGLRIGAMTRHVDIERVRDPQVRAGFGVLPQSAGLIGHLPIRTRGTFGGSLAHADPRAEWCLLAVLLDAEVVVHGTVGERVLDAQRFFTGPHRTGLGPDEIIVAARFRYPAPTAVLTEFAMQQGAYAEVAAAVAIDLDEEGRIAAARIALGGVAGRPIRVPDVEVAILGELPDPKLFDHAGRLAADAVAPMVDGDRSYHLEVTAALTARAVQDSVSRTGRQPGDAKSQEEGGRP